MYNVPLFVARMHSLQRICSRACKPQAILWQVQPPTLCSYPLTHYLYTFFSYCFASPATLFGLTHQTPLYIFSLPWVTLWHDSTLVATFSLVWMSGMLCWSIYVCWSTSQRVGKMLPSVTNKSLLSQWQKMSTMVIKTHPFRCHCTYLSHITLSHTIANMPKNYWFVQDRSYPQYPHCYSQERITWLLLLFQEMKSKSVPGLRTRGYNYFCEGSNWKVFLIKTVIHR